ncbi:MAG: hypothetical protein ACOX7J_06855 [Bacillota bacterium]|jgi:hypothetical protein
MKFYKTDSVLASLDKSLSVNFPFLQARVTGITDYGDYRILLKCRRILEDEQYSDVSEKVKREELVFAVNVLNRLLGRNLSLIFHC